MHCSAGRRVFPSGLDDQLKNRPMLFVGCELPRLVRAVSPAAVQAILRLSRRARRSSWPAAQPLPESRRFRPFLKMYCRSTLVQQLDMEPTEFVAELRRRWEQKKPKRPATPVVTAGAPKSSRYETSPEIFISYRREDAEAARRLCDAITALGGDAWLEFTPADPGDAWQQEILSRIRRTVCCSSRLSPRTPNGQEKATSSENGMRRKSDPAPSGSTLHRAGVVDKVRG